MVNQHHKHPSQYTRPELSAMPRLERLGITREFIALMREVEAMNGHDGQGGESYV
jgi:hypothetical protein